jgi:glycosyltransferase involved in cell wall biosynthesis
MVSVAGKIVSKCLMNGCPADGFRMNQQISLTIIVPVYNEQYLAEPSLDRLFFLAGSPILESVQVIVVDDGSKDRTPAALERFRLYAERRQEPKFEWLFLRHDVNQGKGAAIRTGIEHANKQLTVIHDADLEYHPQDLIQMANLFLVEEADAVYGSRFVASPYRRVLFFRHELGNRALTLLSNLVSDLNLTDMETCYKMIRTDLLKSIPLFSNDFAFEPEITIKLAKRGARIFEVPIRYSGRGYEEGKKIGWKDGIRCLGAVVRFAFSDNIYTGDEHGAQILGRLNRAPRYSKWMADVIRPYIGESVLEIGAGTGNLAIQLIPRPVYCASDVNPYYLDRLTKLALNRPYLQVCYTDGEKGETYPQNQRFDTVVCLNVVEHLKDDAAALRNIYNVLTDSGRAIVLVPCGQWLYGTLDTVLGHCRRYSVEQLAQLAESVGFAVEEVLPFNRAGIAAWWLNGRVLRRSSFGIWQIKLLNLLTPLFRRIDPWLPMPPLSIIAILRRPAAAVAVTNANSAAATHDVLSRDFTGERALN